MEKNNQDNLWLIEKPFSHRGLHNHMIKENTIEAFSKSIDNSFQIELDVCLTKDKKVIVFHDKDLKRMFGINKKVIELTYHELLQSIGDFHVPLLSEVLNLVESRVGLMIELKSVRLWFLEREVMKILDDYKGKYAIVSFNPFSLFYFRIFRPLTLRGQIYSNSFLKNKIKIRFSEFINFFFTRPHFISCDLRNLNVKIVRKMKNDGYLIIGWTYTLENKGMNYEDLFDNLIFEDIDINNY